MGVPSTPVWGCSDVNAPPMSILPSDWIASAYTGAFASGSKVVSTSPEGSSRAMYERVTVVTAPTVVNSPPITRSPFDCACIAKTGPLGFGS
jgi:hypothetical protein